jgi:pantoate--beta-alanine ligase
LFKSLEHAKANSLKETKEFVETAIRDADGLELEYYQIVDGNTLQEIAEWGDSEYVVGCIALFCGKIRLIDNIVYKK